MNINLESVETTSNDFESNINIKITENLTYNDVHEDLRHIIFDEGSRVELRA